MNTLIIDDDPVVRMLASKMLEVKGYVVSTASDEDSLKEYLISNSTSPELILVDLQIGDLNGVDAIKFVKETYGSLPRIICMSSHSGYEAEDLFPALKEIIHNGGKKFDFDKDFLQKPFQSSALYGLLAL